MGNARQQTNSPKSYPVVGLVDVSLAALKRLQPPAVVDAVSLQTLSGASPLRIEAHFRNGSVEQVKLSQELVSKLRFWLQARGIARLLHGRSSAITTYPKYHGCRHEVSITFDRPYSAHIFGAALEHALRSAPDTSSLVIKLHGATAQDLEQLNFSLAQMEFPSAAELRNHR